MKLYRALFALPLLLATPPFKGPYALLAIHPAGRETWSTGAIGVLDPPVFAPGDQYIDLRTVGTYDANLWAVILDYKSLVIPVGTRLRFHNHESGAPVVIRATGPINIAGEVILDGEGWADYGERAEPGPGGFRGGTSRFNSESAVAAGHGPGGGGAAPALGWGGFASYGSVGFYNLYTGSPGATYSGPSCSLLIGGSGGGGCGGSAWGPGAGGGALLIGSNTSLRFSGRISVRGGGGPACGSGGMIRIATRGLDYQGGVLDARGGQVGNYPNADLFAGNGRIRIETELVAPTITATPEPSYGSLSEFLASNLPTVTVQAWFDDNGQRFDIDQDPRARITSAIEADVPLPQIGTYRVRIAGRGVPLDAPLEVRVTNTRGQATMLPAVMGSAGGDGAGELWTDVMIDFGADVATVQVRALLQ